ncbi:molecular chaperone HtpG [Sodalis-like secondary symbiont of Drepanosiphum platanoidis]|uniref:molecular chaperone HtpG n=1 Tax=Sodalis-like secondary symbiont of Drepanosiphum platanoidis TaxID=2994493 RepID=UPI003464226D
MSIKETRVFESEVKELLHLMIHSLYSNKEIFLRELISNASDASDKLRFKALSNPKLYEGNSNLFVNISFDKKDSSITVEDNGIGMTYKEVINNLGTIAKSGTKSFLKSINKDVKKDQSLIGQFGVGFYSSFIISKKVVVYTRYAGYPINKGVLWESTGEGSYNISYIDKDKRGTKIILYLRDNENEFLDDWRLKNIINKYSNHISLPVRLKKSFEKNKENNNLKKTDEWETINQAKALWIRNKSEISEIEYQEFYKYLSQDVNDALIWSHNNVEGSQEYTSLLYIPKKSSWNAWDRNNKHGLKLYVQRVFIMDNAKQLLPNYLRFVKGLVDSKDLPLNISREILQDNTIIKKIKLSLTNRILSMINNFSEKNEKEYNNFWNEFGLILKEGPAEDSINNKKILELLRFSTTYNKKEEEKISLKTYTNRMIEKQKKIYYISSDSYSSAKNSPHLELLKKNNIEVLLLFDRVDEWMMSYITEYNNIPFASISKIDSSLEELLNIKNIDNKKEDNTKNTELFVKKIKNYLNDRIKEVKISYRLVETPAVLTTDSNDMSTQMAKLFEVSGQKAPEIKYVFEININHKLIKNLYNINNVDLFNEWVELLFEQALLSEKGSLEDPNKFIKRINKLILLKNN